MTPLLVLPLRVAWVDTDASGRIHWSAVFRWAELAEHALLRSLGRGSAEAGPYPRRHTEAVYHHGLHFDDEIEFAIGVEKAGRTSVTFGWRAMRGDEVCVEGRHTVVHVDEHGRPAPWPASLRYGLGATPVGDPP